MNNDFVRTENQARDIAETFCEEQLMNKNSARIQQLIYPLDNDHLSSELYIYSLSPIGFIIVSGDTRAHTILGYSFDNALDIKKRNVWNMIETYKNQIKHID
ncbi:Spi family protease inhibitor [Streptococcus catagoni]|uniref:Spi family protease inhibitor n=1 Tax=Streptococcus catagoni TaxID=2654874 RepID=UPI00140DD78C|nr:Spi family protease inhibitor [Streptococcus catagoni]